MSVINQMIIIIIVLHFMHTEYTCSCTVHSAQYTMYRVPCSAYRVLFIILLVHIIITYYFI